MTDIRKLTPDEISVKVKQISDKGCLLLLYKTARVDAQILDETFGATGWANDFKEIKGNLSAASESNRKTAPFSGVGTAALNLPPKPKKAKQAMLLSAPVLMGYRQRTLYRPVYLGKS